MKQGHSAKTCNKRLSCRSYKGNHPTDMHRYVPNDKLKKKMAVFGQNGDKKIANKYADVTVAITQVNSDTDIINICIAPVKIQHWKNIRKEVLAYALLGICHKGSFIQEDLVKELQLSGRKTPLNMKNIKC